MKRDIKIVYKPYDSENIIIFFESNGKDIGLEFVLCEFVREMNHWDKPVKIGEFEGEKGFIFNKSISKSDLEMEISRFIKHNKLDYDLD